MVSEKKKNPDAKTKSSKKLRFFWYVLYYYLLTLKIRKFLAKPFLKTLHKWNIYSQAVYAEKLRW
jgi:hypothetical protein